MSYDRGSRVAAAQKFANDTNADIASRCPGASSLSTPLHQTCERVKVIFDLYVMQDADVVQLELEQPNQNEDCTLILEVVNGNFKHWQCSKLIPLTQMDQIKYRYSVTYSEGFVKKVVNLLTRSKQKIAVEVNWRRINQWAHQYDIFFDPQKSDRFHPIFTGQFFFVQMIYQSLGSGHNLKEHLIECEHIHFGHASYFFLDVDEFRKWISKTVTPELKYFQSAFLCSLLAQFFHRVKSERLHSFLSSKDADNLLKPLANCPREELPESTLTYIKAIAANLLERGTARGCLPYISYFGHLFEAHVVVQEAEMLPAPKMESQFNEYAANALTTLSLVYRSEDVERLASFIISRAPSFKCLWIFYSLLVMFNESLAKNLSSDFFRRFQDILSSTRCLNVLDLRAEVWQSTPKALRKILADHFCKVLVHQVKKESSPLNQERLETLQTFVMDEDLQSSEVMLQIFETLSTSTKEEVLIKVVHFFNLSKLDSFWRRTPLKDKKHCCLEWMQSFCKLQANYKGTAPWKDAVMQSLGAMERIQQTLLVQNDRELMAELVEWVRSKLSTASLNLLMDAYEDAEKLSREARNIYRQQLKEKIWKQAGAGDVHTRIKNLAQFLMSSSGLPGSTGRKIDGSEDVESLASFIISRAPSFECLWIFYTLLVTSNERLAKNLLSQVSRRFQDILSRSRCPNVLDPHAEVWQSTPKALRKILADHFCKVLVHQVKKESSPLNQERLETLQTFVMDEDLQSSEVMLQIFETLSTSTKEEVLIKVVHFFNLSKLDSFWRRTPLKDKKHCCLEWMQSFCKLQANYKGTAPWKDAVMQSLGAMERIQQTLLVQNDRELMAKLVEWVRSKLSTASLNLLMDAYEDAEKLSREARNIYRQQLKEKIWKQAGAGDVHTRIKNLVQSLMSSSGLPGSTGRKIDGAKGEILSCILDLIKLPKVQELRGWEETLKQMGKYQGIWPTVLGALNEKSQFRDHPQLHIAVEALTLLKQGLDNGHINVGFLLDLKVDEIHLFGTCCALIEDDSKFGYPESAEKNWMQNIIAARQEAEQFEETFHQLESTLHFLEMVASDFVSLTDVNPIVQDFNKRKKYIRCTILGEAFNDNYWGPLLLLKAFGEEFSMLEKSVVFKNVARSCLDRRQRNAAMETLNPTHGDAEFFKQLPMTVDEVLELLTGEGVQVFRSTCNHLLEGCSNLLVKQAEVLFNGLVGQDDLKKELTTMAEFSKQSYSKCERTVSSYLKYPILQRRAQQLISAVKLFHCNVSKECPILVELKQFAICCQLEGFTLAQLSKTVDNFKLSNQVFDEDMANIISTLSSSSDLLEFIKDTAKEDIVVLIDAVEEHSDHFVSESVVSNLIDVHRFLRNVLLNVPKDPWDLVKSLRDNYDNLEKSRKSGMAAKIKVCSYKVHSLRGLYMNVANREEMTKEKISNAISKGSYQLGLKSGTFDVILSYHRQDHSDKVSSYGLSELLDLRSRALLIMNTDKKRDTLGEGEEMAGSETPEEEQPDTRCASLDLSEFVVQVDLITDVLQMCEQLHSSGHPDFKEFSNKLQSTEDIKILAKALTEKVRSWESMLDAVRKEYLYLNYFHADQLWILSEFFVRRQVAAKGCSLTRAGVDLLRFIDTTITSKDVETFLASAKRPKMKDSHEGNLRSVGQTLEGFFNFWKSEKPAGSLCPESEGAVKLNELFVAILEEGSTQTVHVVMSLFENTTGRVPQPSQIVFCHSETNWEEIERLLRRAFVAENQTATRRLHCLANVECLPNDMQFELVAAIKKFQSSTKSNYLLSLVCRGRKDHPIVDQFANCSHHIGGMTEAKLRARLSSLCPNVCVVTSDLPGLGKTELIYEDAALKKKAVVTFPISGPMSRKNLVKRLSTVDISHFECIHFDIGEVDDPLGLDTFLFELIVLGLVTAGTQLYHISTRYVYIEVANTLNHWLRDSLSVTKSFTRKDTEWKEYKNYLVSQEVSSPVQVVCHYLQAKENGTLENKDLVFAGPNKLQPLPPASCRRLLEKFFSSSGDLSFNVIESFINVFSHQLLRFSSSPYFKPYNLKAMMGPGHDVRNRLFKALFEVSKEFASRSVTTCKAVQSEAISEEQATEALRNIQLGPLKTADQMVKRVDNMIQWADNNHLLVVFHSLEALSLSVTALYRDVQQVPASIKDLFTSQAVGGQGEKGLEDFTAMTQDQLQLRLERIACTTPRTADLSSLGYALTPDNILKMALIIQRIRVNIPVIVMGETGCGKTSLVRYLARTCDVPFHVFNFHAGIKEQQIVDFIQRMNREAKQIQGSGKAIWVFLDEINTCDYLGTINEIICHHSIQGQHLSPNLVFIAACNPYRIRSLGMRTTAGLSAKGKADDESSKLVYRVHPLPETMIDYVWDYGFLKQADELAYIGRMVEGLYNNQYKPLLVELLSSSQEYIRKVDNSSCCVSLRDVRRCTVLMKWFHKSLQERKKLPKQKLRDHLWEDHQMSMALCEEIRSVILALAHCYQSRLATTQNRRQYRYTVAAVFKKHGFKDFKQKKFEAVVRVEQEEYLARMELPEGTAINAALRENVFVMLVCILNHIPVFVVGKPGCSKSLSMQVIRSNLRGKDAKDPFLKKLPQLYVMSFQGSKSSTSEGIVKVFEKARKYKSFNKTDDVLPVVLLDEIGLAEVSKHNPLKVLHSLLEPGDGDFPDVAVVGISNWALDPAKMNRANHLSRPEPNVDDLYETGVSIRGAQYQDSMTRSGRPYQESAVLSDQQLRCLAEAYHESQKDQVRPNFHGLRDYYSLIKNLSTPNKQHSLWNEAGKTTVSIIHRALQRNFGGLDDECKIQQVFKKTSYACGVVQKYQPVIVTDLIRDNLYDKTARHLMLITSGDSAIGILDQTLQNLEKEKITIFGSRLEEDLSEDYSYRILSRIILCMERDCVLILRDLENIYGSLYDMLNQNYTVVGGRKNCRIALGPFSNPMCQVHDGFRCIVLKDHQMVEKADPPFLNRFEKQILRFSDVLDPEQHKMIEELQNWVSDISTSSVPEVASQFDEQDMFVGFHDDTLPSLVLHHCKRAELDSEDIIERCKQDLMWIATPGGVLRSLKSKQAQRELDEVARLYHSYFEKPTHNGLRHFLSEHDEIKVDEDPVGMKWLIMTHSNIHTNVLECLHGLVKCQSEKLSSFKSEKQLTKQLQKFWDSAEAELLVLQCKPDLDATHMLLTKSIIEQQRAEFTTAVTEKHPDGKKHVCIIVHEQRARMESDPGCARWQFNFLSGWRQVTIDVLEKPSFPITSILNVGLADVLHSKSLPFNKVACEQFLWCFMQIKYQFAEKSQPKSILRLIKSLQSTSKVIECFKELTSRWIEEKLSKETRDDFLESFGASTWQIAVALDRQALYNSPSLTDAMERYISHLVRRVLARIIYFLEKESAWPRGIRDGGGMDETELQLWVDLLLNKTIFNIDDIPEPQGAESYLVCRQTATLQYPFSHVFFGKIESERELFLEELANLRLHEDNVGEDGELRPKAVELLLHRFASVIERKLPQILASDFFTDRILLYVEDLLDIKSTEIPVSREQRVSFLKAACSGHIRIPGCGREVALLLTQLHAIFWIEGEALNSAMNLFVASQAFPAGIDEIVDNFTANFEIRLMQDTPQHDLYDEREPDETKSIADVLEVFDSTVQPESGDASSKGSQDATDEQHPAHQYVTEEHEGVTTTSVLHPQMSGDGSQWETKKKGPVDASENEVGEKGRAEQEQKLAAAAEGGKGVEDVVEENDEEGEEKDEEEEERSEPRFEEVLINAVCVAMFPTQPVINCYGSVRAWSQTASLLLSLIGGMSSDVPAFHFLHVCNDYASLVVVPESLDPFSLYGLGRLGKLMAMKDINDEIYLDTQECFDQISQLEEYQSTTGTLHERFQEFLVLFYSRCIESNPDTPVRGKILHRISTTTDETMLRFVGPVIHCILWTESETSPGAFEDVLQNPGTLEKYSGLEDISRALDKGINLGLPFVVMCCDLIGEVAFQDIDLTRVSESDDCLLSDFRTATKIVVSSDEDQDVFGLLCAVAYLRSVLSSVARLIHKRPSYLSQDGEFVMLLKDVNTAITTSEESSVHSRKSTVRLFLLKELRRKCLLYDLRNLCKNSENLPALQMVNWQDSSVGKLSFDPFRELTEKTPAEAALANLLSMQKDEGPMTEYLKTLEDSIPSMLQFAAVLIKAFYLIRSTRPLKDTEDTAANLIETGLKGLPRPFRKLIIRTLGREDFEVDELNISPESSVSKVHLATLVLHAGAILASHTKNATSPFSSYFTGSSKAKSEFVLAAAGNVGTGYHAFRNHSPQTSSCVRLCHCSCSVAFADGSDKDFPQCASCQREYVTKLLDQAANADKPRAASRGYVLQNIQAMQDDALSVRQLRPVEFRMLHLLVHAALCAGHALQLFDDAALRKFMSSTTASGKAFQVCFQHIETDLQALCNLLNVQQEDALHLMHCVLEVSTPLLTKSAKLTTEESRLSWEKMFAKTVGPLLQASSKWKLNVDEFCQVSPPSVENQPGASNILDDQESSDIQLAHLFRVTQPNTFNSLRAFYMNSSDQVRKQHPLLGLFLDYHHVLPQIAHLKSLLNWNRIVDSRLSRRLSRKDAKLKIGDVIRGECTGSTDISDKASWEKAFRGFKNSWEEVRSLVMKTLGPDHEVPHLSETSPVAYCLIERRGDGVFLCIALETLLAIQNEFMEKVVAISSTGDCAALSCLHKEGKSAVQVVHVQDASKKEIIHYEWSDELLRYSQRDTRHGQGGQVIYDLRMIEKELAVRFLIGKAYLSRDGLREFIFSKELFHICSDILNELQGLIPQVCLTNEMRVSLISVKEQSLKNVQVLLEHLEIVLCLLKRICGNPEQPLIEFTDSWLSSSRPFPNALLPEPRTAIQLKHVVSLYEFLEDQLAQSSAESAPDSYREPLIEDVKSQMAIEVSNLGKTGDSISVDGIITALQRFMFRYMSSEEMRPHPGGDLLESMMDPSLWPMGSFKKITPQEVVPRVIPSSLTIGHVYSVLSFYQEYKKSQARKRGPQSQLAKGGNAPRTTQPKKHVAKKFRRS